MSVFVSEQPGLGLSLLGLMAALLIGLTLRAVIAPDRISKLVQKASLSIHKDVEIRFQTARVSLANGIWPDLSVIVEDIEIESRKSCWFTPLVEVHQIRLPLSLKHLLRGQILIHEVIADEINLSLRSEMKACKEPDSISVATALQRGLEGLEGEGSKTPFQKPPPTTVVDQLQNVPRENPIDHVQVDVLKIHYLPVAFTSLEIHAVDVQLLSELPKQIQLEAVLHMGGETGFAESNSHADLIIDYLEGNRPHLTTSLNGFWREGDYHLLAEVDLKSNSFQVQIDVHHLPLSQVTPVLKKYKLLQSDFSGRQAWLSGHLKSAGDLTKILKTPAHLTDVQLEGDLGEIIFSHAEIKSWQPFEFSPFNSQIHGLNVHELLVFLNRPHPSPALGSLGVFNGTARYVSPEQLALKGDYSGLEFIFSNQGARQSQTISQISGELSLKQKQWTISVDQIKPLEGLFDGNLQIVADRDFKDLKLQAQIRELTLSPHVQSLMTGGGSFGAVQGQLEAHLHSAEIVNLKGQLRSDQMRIEGLQLSKPKIAIETEQKETVITLSAPEVEVPRNLVGTSTRVSPLLDPLLQKIPIDSEEETRSALFKAFTVQLRTEKFLSMNWSHLQATSEGGSQKRAVTSFGGWKMDGQLFGEIRLSGTPEQQWMILGTRDNPQLKSRLPGLLTKQRR